MAALNISSTVARLQAHLYPDEAQRDPMPHFRDLLASHIRPDHHVLDLGAGAGELNAHDWKGRCAEIVGADFDPRVTENPLLDHGVVLTDTTLPFPDASFDVVFSIYVLEHVEDPVAFATEVHRVLKPGGVTLALSPGRFHYVTLAAALTPTWFHRWYNGLRGIQSKDTFPTWYRLNSRADLRQAFASPRFEELLVRCLEVRPNYLLRWLPLFLIGVLYERVVNSTELLAPFRACILSAFRRGEREGPPQAYRPTSRPT